MENYVFVGLSLLVLSIVYLKLAERFNIIDKPNHRSSHVTPTIRGGGVLFYIAILIFYVTSGYQYSYFVLGVSLIAIVSFIDDIVMLSSTIRLPFQFVAIALCLFQIGCTLDDIFIMIPLLIFGVGFINIYNFMDGINGITGLYSGVVLLGFYSINSQEHIINDDLILYSLLALVVFGFYNFKRKARMFAGDIGSITIAVLIFFIGITLFNQMKSPLLILLVAVYGADTILTIIYRKSIGERLTQPHRHHIYQKSVHVLRASHLKVSLVYSGLQLLINVVVFFNYQQSLFYQYILIGIISLILATLYVYMFRLVEQKGGNN